MQESQHTLLSLNLRSYLYKYISVINMLLLIIILKCQNQPELLAKLRQTLSMIDLNEKKIGTYP